MRKRRVEKRIDDWPRVGNGSDEGSRTMSLGGAYTDTAKFDRERCLSACLFIYGLTNQEAESRKLKIVEFSIGREKKGRVASAEAVGKFWKREAKAKKIEGDMRVIEGG